MAFYTKEDISLAKSLDLYTYLKNYDPDELVKFSRNTYATREHDSLKISNGMWYWFSQNVGGKTALDYLMVVKRYNFLNAVEHLLECLQIKPIIKDTNIAKKTSRVFLLPKANKDNVVIINYLLKRGIDREIIDYCIYNELIYEDIKHNVVFIGYDENKKTRYAGVRGTTNVRYLKDCYGSDKKYSFKINAAKNSNSIHIFESVIDLLSYATILKRKKLNWQKDNLLSLAGVYNPAKNILDSKVPSALNKYLENNKNINKIILHLDNDAAGINSSKAIILALSDSYEVINDPPLYGKDYNDYLLKILNKKDIGERI